MEDPRVKAGEACQRCGETCVAFLQGKCCDLFHVTWPGGRKQNGYVPPDELTGVRVGGSSDYMNLNLCLACGQVQGDFPKKSVQKWLDSKAGREYEFAVMFVDKTWEDGFLIYANNKEEADRLFRHQIETTLNSLVAQVVLMHEGEPEEEE